MGWLRSLFGGRPTRAGVVLALGGGGARGLAHLGVLAVLEETAIPVLGVAGTSAGAIVGAMWLLHGSAAAARQRWLDLVASGRLPALPEARLTQEVTSRDNLLLQFARTLQRGAVLALALERRSLITLADFDRAAACVLDDVTIESLRLPFVAVATDFDTGAPVALGRGSLRQAVAASSAIPAVMPPCRLDGRVLVDGGVVADVPVRQARQLVRAPVLAVETSEAPCHADPEKITVPRALLRAGLMTQQALRDRLVAEADLALRPGVDAIHWSDFSRVDEAIEAGRAAALASLDAIRRLARSRPPGVQRGSPCV